MKYLLLAFLSHAAYAQVPLQSFEDHIKAETVWEHESSPYTEGICPSLLSFKEHVRTAAENSDNKYWQEGDTRFFMQSLTRGPDGTTSGEVMASSIPFRPNPPIGKSTLEDTTGPILASGGVGTTIENKPNSLIIEHTNYASAFAPESGRWQISFYKGLGVIELMIQRAGKMRTCRYEVSVGERDGEQIVDSDRAVPRGATPSGEASRAPAVEATGR